MEGDFSLSHILLNIFRGEHAYVILVGFKNNKNK